MIDRRSSLVAALTEWVGFALARAIETIMLAALMTKPEIKTPLPGPKAAALIARDAQPMSPRFPRPSPLPLRRGPPPGRRGPGCRRQPLPGLHGRHRGRHDRPLASQGGGRDQGAGGSLPAHVRHRLLLQP